MLRRALALFVIASVAAQEAPPAGLHGSLGIDFTTDYFFRGMVQEDQGVIGQPWVEFDWGLYEGDGRLRSLDLTVGLWNSLHDGPTGGDGGAWYESDFYAGLSAQVTERLTFDCTYFAYHSPNGEFTTAEEVTFALALDDSNEPWLPFPSGLQPSVTLAVETAGQADGGDHPGTYLELGIEPSFEVGNLGDAPVSLAVPVTLGLSLHDYYEDANGDDFLGFVDLGVVASAPLTFLPHRAGPWEAALGLHLLLLGDHTEAMNGGDASEWILTFGLSTTF